MFLRNSKRMAGMVSDGGGGLALAVVGRSRGGSCGSSRVHLLRSMAQAGLGAT